LIWLNRNTPEIPAILRKTVKRLLELDTLAGQHSSGNFAEDREKAAEAGRKGGQASSGGTHEQHVKAGQQSHKNS
jgi:general stress protein YciG